MYLHRCTDRPIPSVATALYGRCLVCRLTARHSFSQTLAWRKTLSSSPTPGSDNAGSGLASAGANWMYTDMDGLGCCARPPPPGRLALPPPLPPPPPAPEYPSSTGGASRGRTPSILPPSPRYNAATGMSMEPRKCWVVDVPPATAPAP